MPPEIESTLTRLRNAFIAQLPSRVEGLERRLAQVAQGEAGAAARLHHAVHRLVGAAGVHRLMDVAAAARRLESLAATLPAEGGVDAPGLFALHKALARLAAAAEQPAPGPGAAPGRPPSLRVLVVDDDADRTRRLREMLGEAGFLVETCARFADCRAACGHGDRPAAVIAEIRQSEPGADAQHADEVKALRLRGVPVIFLAPREDMAARLAALRAGASHCLATPVERTALLQALAATEAAASARPCRVLVVDDDPGQLADAVAILQEAGIDVRGATDPLEVPGLLEVFDAETLVLDLEMPRCSGPELAAVLHGDGRNHLVPVVYLSTAADAARQFFALEHGGELCLAKPVEPAHLVTAVTRHAYRHRQAREQVETLRATVYERERQQHALDAHAIVSITDTDGAILYVNDRFCEASGYSRQELLGQNHRIIKSGIHPPAFYADMWRTVTRGVIWHGELCNRRKDGSLYWVESSIVPFLDPGGTPYQYISIRTDITRVKEAEQRLARSQAYANIGTWDWNIATGGLYWSERIAPLFGHPEGTLETTYENFLAAIHPDDRANVVGAITACVELGAEYHIEHRVVWPDGSVHWLVERGDVVRDAAGAPLHMLGVVQDITARKQTETALEENRAWLEEAQSLAKLGHWSADMTTGALIWSDEIYRIFGQDPDRFTPSVDVFHQAVHLDDLTQVLDNEQRAAATGVHDIVHRIVRPDGEVRYVHELARPQLDEDGRMVRLTGSVQDVTELKRAEHAMLQAKEAAEAASRAKSEFLASMSHELRTPLNSILGFAQLFGLDPDLPDRTREHAREIERAGQHLLSLVNDLIDLARIEAGRMELFPAPVSLKGVVGDSLAMVAPIARERGIRMIDAGGICEQTQVLADATRLQQVLINLLANAIKYNRPDGTVHLVCRAEGARVRVSITDTGPGIPAEKQSRMFNPFDRLGAERGQVEGSGIGLVITQRIVEAMGGTLGFESTEGRGSTFWVEMPFASTAAPVPAPAPAPHAATTPALRSHVLYIEDNPMNQRLMQQIFAAHKQLELRTAHTAEIGIQLARVEQPALILMDINLPGMDGYAALAALRADPRTTGIPVVAVSANAMKGDEKRGLEAGFAAYLTKPIDIPSLFRALDELTLEQEAG